MGMPDFDRTLPSFYMQDEPARKLVNLTGIINANAFSKVKEAFKTASFAPAFA